MTIGLKHISVLLLFILGVGEVCADPGGNRWGEREFTRAFSRLIGERRDQRNDSQMQMQNERGRAREFGGPDNSGYGNQGGNPSNNANLNSRKQGSMTPEERRALRRQIDEAGHDIYPQRR